MKANREKYQHVLDNILSSRASIDKNSMKGFNFDENDYSLIGNNKVENNQKNLPNFDMEGWEKDKNE